MALTLYPERYNTFILKWCLRFVQKVQDVAVYFLTVELVQHLMAAVRIDLAFGFLKPQRGKLDRCFPGTVAVISDRILGARNEQDREILRHAFQVGAHGQVMQHMEEAVKTVAGEGEPCPFVRKIAVYDLFIAGQPVRGGPGVRKLFVAAAQHQVVEEGAAVKPAVAEGRCARLFR